MDKQKPMWQYMKEKMEEKEYLKRKEHKEKIDKILKDLENGRTYVFYENVLTSVEVSEKNCSIPKFEDGISPFAQYIMATIKIGGNTVIVNLPLFKTEKWTLINDYLGDLNI